MQNGARIAIHRPETACHPLTTRGPSCTMDCGSSKIEEGLQAHCKNQPSVHGQLAGISKLNPRRLGTRFYKSEVRSDLASAERAGSAGKHCSSRARGDKNSRSPPPRARATEGKCWGFYPPAGPLQAALRLKRRGHDPAKAIQQSKLDTTLRFTLPYGNRD